MPKLAKNFNFLFYVNHREVINFFKSLNQNVWKISSVYDLYMHQDRK